MVRITNNKDKNLRYVVSGSQADMEQFNEIVDRMVKRGWLPTIKIKLNDRLIATYGFKSESDKSRFRAAYNSERSAMKNNKVA